MDLRFIDVPKIENDVLLEDLIKDIFECDVNYSNVNLNGRAGQKQDGVDVFARCIESSTWIGIQCKVRTTNKPFTKEELLAEVNLAKRFNPKISEYYLCTTLSRDGRVQELEREINNELNNSQEFLFQIFYWEDIESKLKQPEFETVYYRYYHQYFKDNLTLGHAIGKLVNLELHFDWEQDTHCELVIGKIPRYKNNSGQNVDYFRGTYFIINLLAKKIEFFQKAKGPNQPGCFPSDIAYAFETQIDSYRVCKWLNEIEDIDKFIYNDTHKYSFSIPEKERRNYFKEDEE